jgi:ribosomal protein S27AE
MGEGRRDWQALFTEAEAAMREWRKAHPRATFTEIETTLDEEMARVRAQMLEELALDSASADWRGKEASERPKCPLCGTAIQANGEHKRQLVTEHEQNIELRRSHGLCPECGASFFPPG